MIAHLGRQVKYFVRIFTFSAEIFKKGQLVIFLFSLIVFFNIFQYYEYVHIYKFIVFLNLFGFYPTFSGEV